MASHIIDSELFGAAFAPQDIAEIFTDQSRVQKWFDIEAALAEAQAELGIIPAAAAKEIRAKAKAELVDFAEIAAGIAHTGHLIVPALRALEEICEGDAGEYIHYGATTQDIMDTAMVLQVKEAWAIMIGDLAAIRTALAAQAKQHRGTVMVGRTHGQHALPITYGYKLAVWVDEIDRHLERAAEAEKRIFTGNVTGAVGTMASFGEQGIEMQRLTLEKLGLAAPNICWHSARDRVVEIAFLLTQFAGTMGKIAREVFALQKTEVGELREPFHMGKVGSSTMPHKQNPSVSELSIALARLVRGMMLPLTDALFHEDERDAGLLRIELAAVPELVIYTGAILDRMRFVVEGMEARPERMAANADLLGGLLLSERVMLALGEAIGKQTAHEVVYEVAMKSQEEGVPFRAALGADERVSAHLDAAAIEELLDPAGYIGLAPEIVDGVVAK
ncbi:MAG: adenylosuccinate lyase [Alphaproteobacteria bacterium]|nr:adenylosuccinate lyase [Alphaproteobacteria bacterium]